MKRESLETAITELGRLLLHEESKERAFQAYFERNLIVFEVLGYRDVYPHVVLPLASDECLVPDFLVVKPDNLVDVFEIKTPQEKLVVTKKSRSHFRAKINEYIAQIEKYGEYFDDENNRRNISNIFRIDVQKKPDLVLVVGKEKDVSKHEIHALARQRKSVIRIITYDDLLSLLHLYHMNVFGSTGDLPGASCYLAIELHKLNRRGRKYIFDSGLAFNRDRWSVFLDERDHLCFEVIDSTGTPFSVLVKQDTCGYSLDKPLVVYCEFGSSENFAIIRILINNKVAAQTEVNHPIPLHSNFHQYKRTIGADLIGSNNGSFVVGCIAINPSTADFQKRQELTDAFLEYYSIQHQDHGAD